MTQLIKNRVHIAPVGFEIDRVVIPLLQTKADKVWLILKQGVDESIEKPYMDEITSKLQEKSIDFVIQKSTITDLFDVLNTYREIIENENGNEIFINVSTGSKIQAIAGMMACMMFKTNDQIIIPYYVEPEGYQVQPESGEQMSTGCKDIKILPNYRIDRPSQKIIKALDIINKNFCDGSYGKISKRNLIEKCKIEGIINITKARSKNTKAAEHSQLNKNIIDPLLAWRLIKIEGKGIIGRIVITEEGKNMLRFLKP